MMKYLPAAPDMILSLFSTVRDLRRAKALFVSNVQLGLTGMMILVNLLVPCNGSAEEFSCKSPTASQLHTLKVLARSLEMEYRADDCDRLYQELRLRDDLNLERKRISDLTPLAGLSNLSKLILDKNRIEDLSALSGLVNLEKLFLGNNRISDISPLAPLQKLTYLYLNDNEIVDIAPLFRLKKLKYLFLSRNRVTDLRPLRHSYHLTWLFIDHNQIDDISPLRRLKYIRKLNATGNPLVYAGSIAHFPNFRKFRLPENVSLEKKSPEKKVQSKVKTEAEPVEAKSSTRRKDGVGEAESVTEQKTDFQQAGQAIPKEVQPSQSEAVAGTETVGEIPDAAAEKSFPGSEETTGPGKIDETLIASLEKPAPEEEDIRVPEYFVGETYPLLCSNPNPNQAYTLKVLAKKVGLSFTGDNCNELYQRLNKLVMLIIRGQGIVDVSSLGSLTNLTWLFLYNNRIEDVSPLSNLKRLNSLGLNHNRIEDISTLGSLRNLATLSLHNNRIRDISALARLHKLTSLSLHNNMISDITPLAGLKKLKTLKLNNNSVVDVSPLRELSGLKDLHLRRNSIQDISPLKKLVNLKRLDLRFNDINDFSAIQDLEHFEAFQLKDEQAVR